MRDLARRLDRLQASKALLRPLRADEVLGRAFADQGLDPRVVLAADGRVLPFRADAFDALVHADVFC